MADMGSKNEGKKLDDRKLRYDLIPAEALEALAEVYTLGARKYGDNNYLNGIKYSRVYAALVRHLQAFWQGESIDPDDGQYHLASVAWGAFTLLTYESRQVGEDDRPWCPFMDMELDIEEGETPHDAFEFLPTEEGRSNPLSHDEWVKFYLGMPAHGDASWSDYVKRQEVGKHDYI